jgi:hypothetical protein
MGLDGLNYGAAKHGIQPPGILQQLVNVGSGYSVHGWFSSIKRQVF